MACYIGAGLFGTSNGSPLRSAVLRAFQRRYYKAQGYGIALIGGSAEQRSFATNHNVHLSTLLGPLHGILTAALPISLK